MRMPYKGSSLRDASTARCACPAPTRSRRLTPSASRLHFRFFALAQLFALHLARGGHRQGVDELDLLRVFIGGKAAANVVLYFFGQPVRRRISRLQDDERFHD